MINVAAILDHHAAVRPDKIALAWRGGQYTYAQLFERVNAVAAALAERGIGEADHVALLMQNTPEFIETIYAVNRLGAVFLPVNYRLAPAEWRYILEHGRATAIVTEAPFEADLAGVVEGLPLVARLTVDEPLTPAFDRYAEAVTSHRRSFVAPVDISADSLQRLMYTSGTTAHPKGVCITHSNFAWKTLGLLVQFGWNHSDITVVGGPLYHVGALDMGGITTLHIGGTLVLQRKFDAADLLSLIEEYRATNCWLAPAMINQVLQSAELKTRDLSSLKTILSGGEKMPEARLRQLLDALPDVWFADAYGLTETVSSDTFLDRDHTITKLGSVGLPLPHQEVRIVDDAGQPVPAGTTGEIVVRGPKVFRGYSAQPGSHRRRDPRRMVSHRRRRPTRRGRVSLHRGPQERHGDLRRGEHRLTRGGTRTLRTPRSAGSRRDRAPRREMGRGTQGVRRRARGRGRDGRGPDRLLPRPPGPVQGSPLRRVHRRPAPHTVRQGAQTRTARRRHRDQPMNGRS